GIEQGFRVSGAVDGGAALDFGGSAGAIAADDAGDVAVGIGIRFQLPLLIGWDAGGEIGKLHAIADGVGEGEFSLSGVVRKLILKEEAFDPVVAVLIEGAVVDAVADDNHGRSGIDEEGQLGDDPAVAVHPTAGVAVGVGPAAGLAPHLAEAVGFQVGSRIVADDIGIANGAF